MLSRNCEQCGKKFFKDYYTSKSEWFGNKRRPSGVKFCSRRCYYLSKKGKSPWNKNLKGVCIANEGSFKKGLVPWNKNLKGYRAGELNNNWKGGITPAQDRARKSLDYKQWRKAVLKKDNYVCRDCGKRGGRLQAHHLKPFSLYPELRFSVENGIALCVECHRKTDTWGARVLQFSN